MVNTIHDSKPDQIKVYSDLLEYNINRGSIPTDILVTVSKPDLVVIDTSTVPQTIYLYELTVCFEKPGNLEAANNRKKIQIHRLENGPGR